jgi:DNA N-6-adenine-methyltransferase (Dam)
MNHKPEPDTTLDHAPRSASPPGGAQLHGGEQTRLFDLPQEAYTSDDYYTPKWIFDLLNVTFDLDVACPPQGPMFTPTRHYYTQADDGLSQPWHGRVWMNPPFSNPLPWVEKFVNHENGIALVPTSNGRWMDILWASNSHWVTLKSLKFWTPTGPAKGGMPTRCWLVAMGQDNKQAIANVGQVR